jgi:membrane associated rhomboid family serine protease
VCQFESGRGHQHAHKKKEAASRSFYFCSFAGIIGPVTSRTRSRTPMPQIPPLTKYLMLACTAIFCLQSFVNLSGVFALWPIGSGNFMPWQVVSYAFLHGSIGHLFFNMLGLWMFGSELERLWGPQRYWQFLLAGVLAAAGAQLLLGLLGLNAPTLGASGAIFALLLAYALMFPRREFDLVGFLPVLLLMIPSQTMTVIGTILYVMLMTNRQAVPIPPIPVKALVMVAIYGGVELLMGLFFRDGIAHFAHLGGMAGAYLMIRYWRGQPPFGSGNRRR